jgi:hypothetical protein
LGPAFDWIPRSILCFDTDDCFLLVGVIVVWYFAGRALDDLWGPRTKKRRNAAIVFLKYALLLALGVILFVFGRQQLGPHPPNYAAPDLGAVLTLMWAVALIFLSGKGLARVTRDTLSRSA